MNGEFSLAKAVAMAERVPIEFYIEQINEYFLDTIGDSVVEGDGEEFFIVDDYREDILKWLAQ